MKGEMKYVPRKPVQQVRTVWQEVGTAGTMVCAVLAFSVLVLVIA